MFGHQYMCSACCLNRFLLVLTDSLAALVTFWIYDYVCSLREESRWTKIKGLYIIARYVPFVFITAELYLVFHPNENPDNCRVLVYILSYSGLVSFACSECIYPFPARHVLLIQLT
ncbi:hypothetical protein DEU56DRAFT_756168 [Suillus clintonianus]|uniref:uncharacterized protein n=1 Tax=Suillus clintonianus TaxID=1904413 RepID=UPI001B86AEAE|nr:uncharacterized protein DEU56DRAFT_756168 [Suillus clintonianus]KAG2137040.1 hypothetical protein DEU56DRAFT_756168 [Suillus clintonianus]